MLPLARFASALRFGVATRANRGAGERITLEIDAASSSLALCRRPTGGCSGEGAEMNFLSIIVAKHKRDRGCGCIMKELGAEPPMPAQHSPLARRAD